MSEPDAADLRKMLEASVRACSFCGNDGQDGNAIFCTSDAAICEDCVAILNRKIKQTYGNTSRTPSTRQ